MELLSRFKGKLLQAREVESRGSVGGDEERRGEGEGDMRGGDIAW